MASVNATSESGLIPPNGPVPTESDHYFDPIDQDDWDDVCDWIEDTAAMDRDEDRDSRDFDRSPDFNVWEV